MKEIKRLIQGFSSFKNQCLSGELDDFQCLVTNGQEPKVLMIACVDSRVDPALITQSNFGEMLVLRNVANLVPPYRTDSHYQTTASTIEFAVGKMDVDHIIVKGHSQCGGITSLLQDVTNNKETFASDHPLGEWMQIMEHDATTTLTEFADAPLSEKVCHCTKKAIKTSLKNLMTYPWIQEAIEKNELKLHGWYFNLETADLEAVDPKTGKFQSLLQ